MGRNLADLFHNPTGTSRYQTPNDNVLLEANQRVGLAVDRCVGKDACRFLEGSGGEERTSLQRSLGDAEKNGNALRRITRIVDRLAIGFFEVELIDLFA